jgi:hypothetical protein
VLGHFEVPAPVPVLMMCGEGGRIPYTRRLLRIADAYGVNLADLPLFSTSYNQNLWIAHLSGGAAYLPR